MYKKIALFTIFILILGAVISPLTHSVFIKKSNVRISNGKTLYVGGSGPGNYSNIQDAIDNSTDGDSIFVFRKTYSYVENININKSICLIGQDRYNTIIDCNKDENVINIEANNVTICGFTITNMYVPHSKAHGIHGTDINNLKIIECNIINNKESGICIWESGNITVTNNLIKSNDNDGIEFYYTNDNIVTDNRFIDTGSGIYFIDSSNNLIMNNNFYSNNAAIYAVLELKNSRICNNNFYSNGGGVYIERQCSNVEVSNNNITNSDEKGIKITHYNDNITISNNMIIGNNIDHDNSRDGGGIYVHYSNDIIISNNIIKDNVQQEIYITDCDRVQISNNEIDSGFWDLSNLYMINCFDSVISNNNFKFKYYENKVIIGFDKMGDTTDFFNLLLNLNTNKFIHNYWNRPRVIPKMIIGSFRFVFYKPGQPKPTLTLPFINIDKNPSLIKNNIGV
jgi:parallel beta-helix repeat protein